MAKTDIENFYDILQNKTGDIMFSVLEREGEPENPELVYDGGEHALLHRNSEHTIILDYINPDIRPSLKKTKEVLIAEHPKADKKNFIREYTAAVKLVAHLPKEYDSLISKHENRTEGKNDFSLLNELNDDPDKAGERVRRMLRKNPGEVERVVQFYINMAEDGNVGAQYELANFYLEGLGVEKDEAKAKEWLQKAAGQGHEEAIKLLDYKEKTPIVITERRMISSTEITCTQCGTVIKLKFSSSSRHCLIPCPKCGKYYDYTCLEPIMDGGPDEWA